MSVRQVVALAMLAGVLSTTASAQSRVIRETEFKFTSRWTPVMKGRIPATPTPQVTPASGGSFLATTEISG